MGTTVDKKTLHGELELQDVSKHFGDAIAVNAGMSKANVLYYFRTKQDIYDAVLTRTLTVWLDPLKRLERDGDPLEQIWRYAEAKLALSRSAPQASRLFAGEMLRGAPRLTHYLAHDLKRTVDEACSILQAWVDTGRLAPVEPLNLIFLIWSSTQHYADFEPQVRALQPDAARVMDGARRTLRRVLMAGLTPDAGTDAGTDAPPDAAPDPVPGAIPLPHLDPIAGGTAGGAR